MGNRDVRNHNRNARYYRSLHSARYSSTAAKVLELRCWPIRDCMECGYDYRLQLYVSKTIA